MSVLAQAGMHRAQQAGPGGVCGSSWQRLGDMDEGVYRPHPGFLAKQPFLQGSGVDQRRRLDGQVRAGRLPRQGRTRLLRTDGFARVQCADLVTLTRKGLTERKAEEGRVGGDPDKLVHGGVPGKKATRAK